jgi:excinuclease ABC subunit C
MQLSDLKKINLPDEPGVYFFKNSAGKILYIGRATSLRDRVRSYFAKDLSSARGGLIVGMVEKSASIDFIATDSVLEAIILESNLIRKYQPYHNTKEKDDKSFNYVVITRENWPRVMTVRGKDVHAVYKPAQIKYLFGPFPYGKVFQEAIKIIQRIFPFYDTQLPVDEIKKGIPASRLRFNQAIGRYPRADIERKDYLRTINHLKLFFEGKKKKLVAELTREMKNYAKQKEFEKAGEMKRRLFAITHIQDVALIRDEVKNIIKGNDTNFRIEAYDIAHLSGKNTVGVMVVVENGEVKKSEYRKFKIYGKSFNKSNDIANLKEILIRRLKHFNWSLPKLIVVDGGVAQKNAAEEVLSGRDFNIAVVAVVKDERHKPKDIIGLQNIIDRRKKEILLANSEAHRFAIAYHKLLRKKAFVPR